MRIKSNIRDYYDKCQLPMSDDQIYVRLAEEKEGISLGLECHTWRNTEWGYNEVRIAFCGKLYMGIQYIYGNIPATKYLYTIDESKAFFIEHEWKWERPSYWSKCTIRYKYEHLVEDENKIKPYFEKYNTPIIVARKRDYEPGWKSKPEEKVTINDRLNQFNFQTVFTPQAAYQEISMFLGNIHKKEKPIPKIDDVTMSEAKGFDKWSFRKMPKDK